jgi:xanthine/uracil permease
MFERNFDKILYVTGAVTMTPLLQFFFPALNLGLNGLVVGDDAGLFFARHWGLMAACFGALLLFAAARPAVRQPIVMVALVEKLGLVMLIGSNWNTPPLAGLHGAAIFDGICVVLYGAYLYRAQRS